MSTTSHTLASGLITHTKDEGVFLSTSFSFSPERARAVADVVKDVPRIDLSEYIGKGPLTIVTTHMGGGMLGSGPVISVRQGRLVPGVSYGKPGHAMLVLKGARGGRAYDMSQVDALDVRKGYVPVESFPEWEQRVDEAQAAREANAAAVTAALAALPEAEADVEPPSAIGAVLTGTMDFFGDTVEGATWFLTDYSPEDDIANGYLVVPGNAAGAVSEHGSILGKDLARQGFAPRTVPEGLTFAGIVQVAIRATDDGDAMLAELLPEGALAGV